MESVTGLISMLDKPALMKWANKIGLQGIELSKYSKKSKSEGNDIHNKVECFLKYGVDFKGSDKLKKSLEQVKLLEGFLPICASCKQIRDDKGYWNQVEAYIQKHSEVEFSHGICPDCYERVLAPQLRELGIDATLPPDEMRKI